MNWTSHQVKLRPIVKSTKTISKLFRNLRKPIQFFHALLNIHNFKKCPTPGQYPQYLPLSVPSQRDRVVAGLDIEFLKSMPCGKQTHTWHCGGLRQWPLSLGGTD